MYGNEFVTALVYSTIKIQLIKNSRVTTWKCIRTEFKRKQNKTTLYPKQKHWNKTCVSQGNKNSVFTWLVMENVSSLLAPTPSLSLSIAIFWYRLHAIHRYCSMQHTCSLLVMVNWVQDIIKDETNINRRIYFFLIQNNITLAIVLPKSFTILVWCTCDGNCNHMLWRKSDLCSFFVICRRTGTKWIWFWFHLAQDLKKNCCQCSKSMRKENKSTRNKL